MRYIFQVLILVLSFSISGFAQKANPPGTIWLRDNLYVDLTPIANVHYREYEYAMRTYIKYNLNAVQTAVASLPYFGVNFKGFFDSLHITPNPDSTALKIDPESSMSRSEPENFEIYLNHPSYNNYPLVNISYDLAKVFCAWRTAMVQLIYSRAVTEKKRKKYHKKVLYRLATKEEWEYALRKFEKSKRFCQLRNSGPAPRNYFTINNLPELVEEKNILVNTVSNHKPPADSIVFRCICEVED